MPNSLDQWGWLGLAALGAFVLGTLLAWVIGRARVARLIAEREGAIDLQRHLQQDQDAAMQELDEQRQRVFALANERATLAGRLERLTQADSDLAVARSETHKWREACQRAEQRVTETATRLHEQQQAAQERLALLVSVREEFTDKFKSLAGDLLEEKSKKFTEQNEANLGILLNPLREQIGDFRKLVSESYEKENNARVALQTELKTELKQLFELNHRLSDEANSLARALTTENRTQGYWGELRLERLLESSGLEKGREYVTQESFLDAEGDRYRPDAILRLPEGKDIIIDAKVALVAYRESCDATDAAARERALAQHVVAMRAHVRNLGDKDYSGLEGVHAPDLVLMFVPVEAAFLEALRSDPGLYDDAFARKIVIVGPSNLLASLRLVAHLWRTDQQSRNAAFIFERAAAMYDKFVGFVDDINKVGESLDKAQKAHAAALSKLAHGRGNLVRRAEELRRLGAEPSKQLGQSLLEGAGEDEAE